MQKSLLLLAYSVGTVFAQPYDVVITGGRVLDTARVIRQYTPTSQPATGKSPPWAGFAALLPRARSTPRVNMSAPVSSTWTPTPIAAWLPTIAAAGPRRTW